MATAFAGSPYRDAHRDNPIPWVRWDDRPVDRSALVVIGDAYCAECWAAERDLFQSPEVASAMEGLTPVLVDADESPGLALRFEGVGVDPGAHSRPIALLVDAGGRPVRTLALRDATSLAAELRAGVKTPAVGTLVEDQVPRRQPLPEALQDRAMTELLVQEDATYGGWGMQKHGGVPTLSWLLDRAMHGSPDATAPLVRTLTAQALSGWRDHVGGGVFHRTRDASWTTAELDKRLVDNALSARLYLDVGAATGEAALAGLGKEGIAWVQETLALPDGSFAQGTVAFRRYYTWSPDQVAERVAAGDARRLVDAYHLEDDGTVPWLSSPIPDTLVSPRRSLLEARRLREPPAVDERRPTGPNALMVSALCRASAVLEAPVLLDRAREAAAQVGGSRGHFLDSGADATLWDLSWTGHAMLDLYLHDPDPRWLAAAEGIGAHIEHEFVRDGVLYSFSGEDRIVWDDLHDQPTGVGDALRFLVRLERHGVVVPPDLVRSMLERGGRRLAAKATPVASASLLRAHDAWSRPPLVAVFVGRPPAELLAPPVAEPWPHLAIRVVESPDLVKHEVESPAYLCLGDACTPTPEARSLALALSEAVTRAPAPVGEKPLPAEQR